MRSTSEMSDENTATNSCLMSGRVRSRSILTQFNRIVANQAPDQMGRTLISLKKQQKKSQNIFNQINDMNYDKMRNTHDGFGMSKNMGATCTTKQFKYQKGAKVFIKGAVTARHPVNKASKRVINR